VRSSLGERIFLKRCISHRACCLKKQDHRLHARHACMRYRGANASGMIQCLNARLNKKKFHVLAVGIDLAALGKDLDRHQRNQMTSKVPRMGSCKTSSSLRLGCLACACSRGRRLPPQRPRTVATRAAPVQAAGTLGSNLAAT
jgi:hypothetical protein